MKYLLLLILIVLFVSCNEGGGSSSESDDEGTTTTYSLQVTASYTGSYDTGDALVIAVYTSKANIPDTVNVSVGLAISGYTNTFSSLDTTPVYVLVWLDDDQSDTFNTNDPYEIYNDQSASASATAINLTSGSTTSITVSFADANTFPLPWFKVDFSEMLKRKYETDKVTFVISNEKITFQSPELLDLMMNKKRA